MYLAPTGVAIQCGNNFNATALRWFVSLLWTLPSTTCPLNNIIAAVEACHKAPQRKAEVAAPSFAGPQFGHQDQASKVELDVFAGCIHLPIFQRNKCMWYVCNSFLKLPCLLFCKENLTSVICHIACIHPQFVKMLCIVSRGSSFDFIPASINVTVQCLMFTKLMRRPKTPPKKQ